MQLSTLTGLDPNSLFWQPLPGLPGLSITKLFDDLNEEARIGSRTRLVRFDADARTQDVLSHPYWEEVLCLSGSLTDAGVPKGLALSFVRRPPGTPHGPFHSTRGCILAEFQYFMPQPQADRHPNV